MNIAENGMHSAMDVIRTDLDYIVQSLNNEFQKLSGKNVLITGGAGFLGYYLVQSLLHFNKQVAEEEAVNVVVYDNYMRGLPQWLQVMTQDKHLKLIEHDITSRLPGSMDDFQYIIHAASIASPTYYRKYPLETMDANVNGLRYLLEYARGRQDKEKPVEGFLFFSTSEIYGDPDTGHIPTPETYRGNVSCTGPRACYDESKRYGETLCVTFAQQYNVPVKIVRPFNNYGPGLKITDKRVIPDFMQDVLSDNNIKMFSDGSPSRTFCYIADAITGYFKILINGRPGESYNIGVSEPEINMRELAERIVSIAAKLNDYQGQVMHVSSDDSEYLVDNPNRRCPEITKAKMELGYNPTIGLQEGLFRNFLWYKEHKEAQEA